MSRPDLIPSRGAIAEPLLLEVTRELTQEDLLRLGESPKVAVPVLQKLRAQHHRQAQLLAQGKSLKEVAAIVGCTSQRLVQLQNDPTFSELVSYYKEQNIAALLEDSVRLQAKIVDVGEMAVDELAVRLEDDAQRAHMSTANVRQIAEFAMDRTVAPPKAAPNVMQPPAAITINFGTPIDRPDLAPRIEQGKTLEAEEVIDPLP